MPCFCKGNVVTWRRTRTCNGERVKTGSLQPGVFQRKSQGSVLPGFPLLPVQSKMWCGVTCYIFLTDAIVYLTIDLWRFASALQSGPKLTNPPPASVIIANNCVSESVCGTRLASQPASLSSTPCRDYFPVSHKDSRKYCNNKLWCHPYELALKQKRHLLHQHHSHCCSSLYYP